MSVSYDLDSFDPPVARAQSAMVPDAFNQDYMMDDIKSNKRIKKDALWKPLFREFRSFYRTQINQTLSLSDVIHSNEPVERLTKTLEQQSRAYLKEIGAPEHIYENTTNQHAIIVLALPTSARKME